MDECAGPWCSLLIDGDEPFCSAKCEAQYDEWSADMAQWLAEDHDAHWSELGGVA